MHTLRLVTILLIAGFVLISGRLAADLRPRKPALPHADRLWFGNAITR